jgi:PTS system nitrogen regulatory IIA component
MTLNNTLKPENVVCDSTEISSKKQVLERIGRITCHQSENTNYVEVLQALIKRERLGSTVLGHGVAVPHARIENLEQIVVCLITLHTAINFNEDDKTAVDVIFGILAPANANVEQLGILSEISTLLQNKNYRDALRQATTAEELYQAAIRKPIDEGAQSAEKDATDQQ